MIKTAERLDEDRIGGRADYGFDAPQALIMLAVPGVLAGAAAGLAFAAGWAPVVLTTIIAVVLVDLAVVGSFLYATRVGKHRAWAGILDYIAWRGDENGIDLGCGRGAVLIALARRLPLGHVTGVDVWSGVDQSGNAPSVTRQNAAVEGVADRVTVATVDIRDLPFPAGSFDVATSSLVLHNLRLPADRRRALENAVRVLRPGGRLLLADIRNIDEYRRVLEGCGAQNVAVRDFGLRVAFGHPWLRLRLLSCTAPASRDGGSSRHGAVTSPPAPGVETP